MARYLATLISYFMKFGCQGNHFEGAVDKVDCFYGKVADADGSESDSYVSDSYYFIVKLY